MLDRLVRWLLASWILGFAAHAQEHAILEMPELQLRVEASSPWPRGCQKGYSPLFVDLSNQSASRRLVRVVAEASVASRGGGIDSSRTVELAPNEELRVELLIPAFQVVHFGTEVSITADGVVGPSHRFQGPGFGRSLPHFLLLLSERPQTELAVTEWADKLATEHVKQRSGEVVPNVALGHVTFDNMPRQFEAYTSLDTVILDTTDGLPRKALGPLLAWMRLGGTLVLAGDHAWREASGTPELACWMEPRFESPIYDAPSRGFRAAHGRLVVASESDAFLADEQQHEAVRIGLRSPVGWVPSNAHSNRMTSTPVEIPGLGVLPYNALIISLVLIVLVMGPVNFTIARKWNRPALVLVTIPLTALVASLGLIAFGFLHHGIDIKTASSSVTILDQREHQQSTAEARQLFAGLAPGRGLRPSGGTACFPHFVTDEAYKQEGRFRVSASDGETQLTGDFLPTRTSVRQVLITDASERRRLEFRPTSTGYEVQNGLGADVSGLVLRDSSGRYFALEESLAFEQTISMAPASEADIRELTLEMIDTFAQPDGLPPACYIAALRESPFLDDCGIETNELASSHRVIGVLAQDGESW